MTPNPTICPLCGGERIRPYLTCVDHLISGESFPLWHCDSCDGVWTGDAPGPNAIHPYYTSNRYLPHQNPKQGLLPKGYTLVRKMMLNQKARWIEKRVPQSGENVRCLLDIGCGTGHFLAVMRNRGWKVQGIEPDPTARAFAERAFRVPVGAPDSLKELKPGSFDVITLWHSLEHVHEVHGLLDQCRTLLRSTGLLVIALPNRTSWEASHYGPDWAAYDVPRHLWHFSPEALSCLLARYGFRIIEKKALPFDPFYIALLSETHRGHSFPWLPGLWVGLLSWMQGLKNPNRAGAIWFGIRPE